MRNSPYYMSIFNHIVRQIYTGQLAVGDSLDSVKVMCEKFAASANTVVAVVKKLTENGFISTRQGKTPVIISDCGNQRQALEQLCDRFDSIHGVYEVFGLLYPSVVSYCVNHYSKEDLGELSCIVTRMEHNIDDMFVFRDQKGQFINKLIARCGNSMLQEISRLSEEAVMLPRMVSDVAKDAERTLHPARMRYAQGARRVCAAIASGDAAALKREMAKLCNETKDAIITMIRELSESRGYSLGDSGNSGMQNFYLYDIIVSDVIDQLYDGTYGPGDFLPSIDAMCRKYQVSMPTVRSAYKILGELNLAQTINGKGTQITLFSACPDMFYKELDGLMHLTKYWEALQLITMTVGDVALYAAVNMNYTHIDAIETHLRTLWRAEPKRTAYPAFVLLGAIVGRTRCDALGELYMTLKRVLIWRAYLDRFLDEDPDQIREENFLLCLEALQDQKSGKTQQFADLTVSMFERCLEQTRAIFESFGWSMN